eukprot:TRINITY_DN64304_c0_g1_i1.p1 TRINITY_DN64304_c0_g1~~TRINITY_DN64304_c0_g1_i1.p1  ORF type:complete len:168 (-),score=24.28 TRINITY_DN64304_c0_g1_i1:67-570(-)
MGQQESKEWDAPVVVGEEKMMSPKENGTCSKKPIEDLLYNVDRDKADKICCHNRHYAEHSGYAFKEPVTWVQDVSEKGPVDYYDSIHGRHLFKAPGPSRTWEEFLKESKAHGWPSFRDEEVDWEYVRVLPNGETITTEGVHLGHNLPDSKGNRYCINLVCIAAPKQN